MHAKSYLEELCYIYKAIPSWSGRAELFAATIGFHLNNGLRRSGTGRSAMPLEVLLDGERCFIHVRPNRGDLFIFYEVLAREAYAIPGSVLDPLSVRTILDCGANIGITALYFARKYQNARIICVEPDPDNFEILKLNAAGNDRIVPVWAAAVAKGGPVYLTHNRPAYGNTIQTTASRDATIEVPGHTIVEICQMHNLTNVDLLKVDIEGSEKDIFVDPVFLPAVGRIAIELHGPFGIKEFQEAIAPYNFVVKSPSSSYCRHAHFAFRP